MVVAIPKNSGKRTKKRLGYTQAYYTSLKFYRDLMHSCLVCVYESTLRTLKGISSLKIYFSVSPNGFLIKGSKKVMKFTAIIAGLLQETIKTKIA